LALLEASEKTIYRPDAVPPLELSEADAFLDAGKGGGLTVGDATASFVALQRLMRQVRVS
jgi:hypothetical protein